MAVAALDGTAIRRGRAELVARSDLAGRTLAGRLSDQVDGWFDALSTGLPAGWSLVATGGYARGLLCPGSDIDVVLVHPNRTSSNEVKEIAEALWYPIWDAGLKLSPAAHSPKSLLSLASEDLVTATSLLRVRRLAGDEAVVAELQAKALGQWRKRPHHWLAQLRAVTDERWHRNGEVASLLEPDLKDGRGGLRDYDVVRWALQVDRPEVTAALEVPVEELAAPAEVLLAVRCELHRVTGRATNVLLLQEQDGVAAAMGAADADAMMTTISAAARAIDWQSERFWWRVQRDSGRGGRSRPRATTIAPGITVVDGEIDVNPELAGLTQSLIFRVAATAALAGRRISRRSLIALSNTDVDQPFPWSERTRQSFVSLLGAGDHLIDTVEALEHYELFSRMVPEWRAVRAKPQRNAFHTFTVDRHLLQTVANANEFVRDVSRPDLLLIGALLHDIGKGFPGDHTEVGMDVVVEMVGRMGFPPDDVGVIRSLVEHHLLLAETATRRDLGDPRTAENVAEQIGDATRLELLRALTEADSRATGPSAWSSWKATLIDELVDAVATVYAGKDRRAPHVDLDARFGALLASVRGSGTLRSEHEPAGDVVLWRVAVRDQPGLFAKIAGTLATHGIEVVGADAWTSDDGIAVDQFTLLRSNGAATNWALVEHDLRAALEGTVDVAGRLEQRMRTYARAHRRATAAQPPRLEVLITNDASASTTMVDVRAPDAMAVLYRLATALADQGLDIRSAKVATLGHEVVDVFYVQRSEAVGTPCQVPVERHAALREELKASLAAP